MTVGDGTYNVRWFHPGTGEFVGETKQLTGATIEHGAPPDDSSTDWVVLMRNINIEKTEVPTSAPASGEGPASGTPALGAAVGSDEKSGGGCAFLWALLLGFAGFRSVTRASHPLGQTP